MNRRTQEWPAARALRQRLPGLASAHCPVALGELPTPITSSSELAERWGLASLDVKRDDLTSGVYGGSKVRALEWLLGGMGQRGQDGVITLGPWASHHALSTALFARVLGLGSRLVLFPQPRSDEVNRVRELYEAADVDVRWLRTVLAVPFAWAHARCQRLGQKRPHVVPAGATSPVGVLGAAEGALEVAAEILSGHRPPPEDVVVPAGSCGTAAGLLLGFALAGLTPRIICVRVAPWPVARRARVMSLARGAHRLLRRAGETTRVTEMPELVWVTDQLGDGYARSSPAVDRIAGEVAAWGGFRTETTYTAKALAHLAGGDLVGRRVLFWNTFSAVDPSWPAFSDE